MNSATTIVGSPFAILVNCNWSAFKKFNAFKLYHYAFCTYRGYYFPQSNAQSFEIRPISAIKRSIFAIKRPIFATERPVFARGTHEDTSTRNISSLPRARLFI
ncbi:hypothetical protein M405DRAFT_835780 [Rhizopogon salebrosus TDB-379]|nr:hypothetical protein M405DRAFT_835780 [Rhizopogon salebrosus TDB-379]